MSHRRFCCCFITLLALIGWSAVSWGATPQQVQTAIEKGQKWLLQQRTKDGTWEAVAKPLLSTPDNIGIVDPTRRQFGGLTSLATYALLASGVDHREDALKKPIQFLLNANIQGTYGLGLSSQIALFIPEKESRELVKRNVAMIWGGLQMPPLNQLRQPAGWQPNQGFYSYWTGAPEGSTKAEFGKSLNSKTIGTPQPEGWFDRSNSQYAVLGMWALEQSAGEIRPLYWQIEDAAWKKAQLRDGGWNYTPLAEDQREASPSMTAAGIATLFITQDYTLDENWSVCKGGIKNDAIERGLHWMDQHIESALVGNYYTMYGIERIGTASGRKYFGTKDWYQIGADFIVTHQNPDGSWSGSHGPIPDTSFALLFLSRGRAPVMMNKLEYSATVKDKAATDAWDERPRDVANLARWAGKQEESYFNWQVVNLNVPPEELHDAPILYLSGSQPFAFSKEEEDKLRAYVEQGGLIFGNADCGKDPFAKSFIALGKKLFPKYEFRPLATNDLIYTEQFKDFKVKPKLLELSNNVRKLMLLLPDSDASKAWQIHSIQNQSLFGLGVNIFLYAVDKKNLMAKGDTYLVLPNAAIPATAKLAVARLDLGDNPNPEPGGWQRMIGVMHNRFKTDLKVDLVKADGLPNHQVAHITGTGKFSLSAASRSAIKKFVDAGGFLVVDAAGGDIEFADSAEPELGTIFAGTKLETLPMTHPIYNVANDGVDKVGWRDFAISKVVDKRRAKIRGVTFGKRTGIFFSREDLSEGIVGQPVDGIYGYDPETATRIMANILEYAATRGNPPIASATTQPAPAPAAGAGAH